MLEMLLKQIGLTPDTIKSLIAEAQALFKKGSDDFQIMRETFEAQAFQLQKQGDEIAKLKSMVEKLLEKTNG